MVEYLIKMKKNKIMLVNYKTPFKEIFDTLFDDVQTKSSKYGDSYHHSVKITSDDEGYRIKIAVPGLSKEEITLSTKDDEITISYDGKETEFVKPFKRTYNIPVDVDDKNIKGKFDNGLLEVYLPKSKKKITERLISLN